jgi:hypothetical protein
LQDFDFFNSRRSGQQFAGSPFQCLRNLAGQVGTAARFVCKGIAPDEKGTSKWYAIKLGSGRFGIVASGWADPKNTWASTFSPGRPSSVTNNPIASIALLLL